MCDCDQDLISEKCPSLIGVGDIPVRRYYRGKLSHSNHNRTSFSSRRLLRNAHYCAMCMRSGPHAQGTTMASSTRSEVLVRCGISVVKKWNTTSVVSPAKCESVNGHENIDSKLRDILLTCTVSDGKLGRDLGMRLLRHT